MFRLALLLLSLFLLSFGTIAQNNEGLRFIENKGQWTDGVDFQARVPGGRIGVSANGFLVHLIDMESIEHQHLESHHEIDEASGHPAPEAFKQHFFRINLLGANPKAKAIPGKTQEGYYNYFLGNDPAQWAAGARSFGSVTYENVYTGIDFRVSSLGSNLKYDFVVRPGADPSQIRIEFAGADAIEKVEQDLRISTAVGDLRELKPFTYQFDGNEKLPVASEFVLKNNVVSFFLPDDYDARRELIIDPLLIFSTYSGSTADNWGSTATPGEHGTLYSAGVTQQSLGGSFPSTVGAFQETNHGAFDMAIIKYDSAGTRFLYATHLGGFNNDSPESLVVDPGSGDLIVLGISSSPDFPTGKNSFDRTFNLGTSIFNRVLNTQDEWDIVLTRLSQDGSTLIGSTFLGGSGNDGLNVPKQSGGPLVVNYGDEMRGDVITDDDGNVYISSVTSSHDFPIVGGFDDSFNGGNTDGLLVKLSPDLSSIIWSSYLGGSGFDAAYSVKLADGNNIVIAGGTTSADFPVTTGAYQTVFNGIVDGWIARISANGDMIMNATFTGTQSFDQVYFVDLNSTGNIFCYGQTAGNMPVTAGVYHNANSGQFLQKFSSDLSALQFSTVFGSGSSNGLVIPNISPTAFLVNDCDNIYMAGWGGFVNSSPSTGFWQSSTSGMPVTADAHQKTTSGSDFYFMVLNGDATRLVYATYFGGNSSKTHVDGGTSRFDKYGIVYHAVCSGCTFGNSAGRSTSDFPTTPGAKSRINGSPNCNNAAFKFDLSSLRAMFDTNNLKLTMPGFNNVCYPDSIVFQNLSTGGRTIAWDFGDGRLLTQDDTDPRNVIHQYKQTGQYSVKLKITDLSTCSQSDSVTKIINYFRDNILVGEDAAICDGESFRLSASGGESYSWTSGDGVFSSLLANPTVTPSVATSYYVTVVDINGCSRTDTLNLVVIPNVRADFETFNADFSKAGDSGVCYPDPILFKNKSTNGETLMWDFGDGTMTSRNKDDTVSLAHIFQQKGVYAVELKAMNPNTCNQADSIVKLISYFRDEIEAGEDAMICEGQSFALTATGGTNYLWSAIDDAFSGSGSPAVVFPQRTTLYVLDGRDANGCSSRDSLLVTVVDSVDVSWTYELMGSCADRPSVLVRNLAASADDVLFYFDFGDGTVSEERDVEHRYDQDGEYEVRLVAEKQMCSFEESVIIPIYELTVPNVFTPEGSPGYNDFFELVFGSSMQPDEIGVKVVLEVFDRWGKRVYSSGDYRNDWDGANLAGGVYYFEVKVGDLARCKSWVHIIR